MERSIKAHFLVFAFLFTASFYDKPQTDFNKKSHDFYFLKSRGSISYFRTHPTILRSCWIPFGTVGLLEPTMLLLGEGGVQVISLLQGSTLTYTLIGTV